MKILIVFYSRTKQTEKLASSISDEFKKRGHDVDMERIKPIKEQSFWNRFFIWIFKREYGIHALKIKDVSGYDAICVGSPKISLPVIKYLNSVNGLNYKKVGFFATTALPPALEWYIFSAHLPDSIFSKIIDRKKGRIAANVLLSSLFKKWSYSSEYGSMAIKNFCKEIEAPIKSFKDYFLEKKEFDDARLLVRSFSVIVFFFLILQIVLFSVNIYIFTWGEFFCLLAIFLFTYLAMITILSKRSIIFLVKYLAGGSLITVITVATIFLTPILGRAVILGYVLVFVVISFFRDLKTILFTGSITVLGYIFLFMFGDLGKVLIPILDLTLIFLSIGMAIFISSNLRKNYLDLLEILEDAERSRKKVEEEKNKTRATLISLTDGLIVLDPKKRITLVNPRAVEILGVEEEKILNKSMDEVSNFYNLNKLYKTIESKVECSNHKYELVLEKPIKRSFQVSIAAIKDQEKTRGLMIVLHDITREKIVAKLKSEFVSVVAHQLRTPLTALKWIIKMILKGDLGELNEEQQELLSKGCASNERVIKLVDDLLNVSSIEEGRFGYNFEDQDFQKIVNTVIENYESLISKKHIELVLNKSEKIPKIYIDKDRILMVVQNLVENAIKYTPEHGKVEIDIKEKDEFLEVTVKDNGVGIPQNDQFKIFSKFFRAANAISLETEGTGLGLFIAKNVIEKHKGKISLKSEEGVGTEVCFSLPLHRSV